MLHTDAITSIFPFIICSSDGWFDGAWHYRTAPTVSHQVELLVITWSHEMALHAAHEAIRKDI